MCNAWNHSYDCPCGFGGEFYQQAGFDDSRSAYLWTARTQYESFLVPNARCPVCDAYVYFYQSPFGGRVFFDDLGIPWPKHPCTDTSSSSNVQRLNIEDVKASVGLREVPWKKDGWRPFTAWHFSNDKLFGTYAEYVNKLEEKVFDWADRSWTSYKCTEHIKVFSLLLPEGENWFQQGSCIFMIYPTFIRDSDRGSQFFDLATFKLERGRIVRVDVRDAYVSRLQVDDTLEIGTSFSYSKKSGAMIPKNYVLV